ncbi:MAG: hypothetical protein ACOYL9_00940 [Ilumatobacteraceae bacterium]|jgi:hypothetical protein
MRQFFTWGFWLALLSLVGLTVGLVVLTGLLRGNDAEAVTAPVVVPGDPEREIDLIDLVYYASADPGFAIVDGVTTGTMRIEIDGFRTMIIPPGTPGENRCAAIDQLAKCAVAADLLGDSVLWFSLVPIDRDIVTLPAMSEVLKSNRARLSNNWIVRRADVVKRNCSDDTLSLRDFIQRYGDAAVSSFDIRRQQIVSVTCGGNAGAPTG